MNQLVALQEIYASFSKGGDGLQKIDNKTIEGSCYELISKLLDSSRKGRIDEEVCRELSLKLQDVYEIKRLGDICRRAGFPVLAISTYNRAATLCSDPVLLPVLQNNLGQAYAHQGDLAKASFYYQKAADCFAREGDYTGLAHVLGNLGSAYRRSGEWDRAIEHYYRSLKTFEEKGDDLGIAQMTGSLGRVYSDMGEKELAARYFERSLIDFQRLGDKRSAAWVLDRLGRIAGQRKDWDKALGYFNSSLSLFEEQGESQSQGIVLSNLGRVYLQMDEATAAREPLERAVLLTSRQKKPNYQNALYCLAKTYSSLAKNCLKEAENDEGSWVKEEAGRIAGQQQRQEASRLYSQAADRYQELASTLAEGQAEIKADAAIARGRSYLARLCGKVQGEEALMLMEKALSSLDDAAANARDPKKAWILGLQRIVAGMKEARSIGLYANDPLMQSRALTNASEYLMGGAQGLASEEESGFLCQALKNINAGIEVQKLGRDPTEKLQAAAADLRNSEKHFGAAEVLAGSAANVIGQCQAALLLIAGSMASYSLSKIDDSSILTWDESLHLLPMTEKGESAVKIKIYDLQTEPNAQSIEKTDMPVLEISRERPEARDLILADGSTEASQVFVSEIVNPEAGWLVPSKAAVACKSSGQLLLPVNRQPSEYQLDENQPEERQPFHEKKDMPLKPEDTRQESYERAFPEGSEETNERSEEQPLEAGIEDTDPRFREAVPDHEIEEPVPESPFSRSKAIFLFKSLSVLLVILLAIEAILYLI